MNKINIRYSKGAYYINNEPLGSFCNHETVINSITKMIEEELTLVGIKNGFTITIEEGNEVEAPRKSKKWKDLKIGKH